MSSLDVTAKTSILFSSPTRELSPSFMFLFFPTLQLVPSTSLFLRFSSLLPKFFSLSFSSLLERKGWSWAGLVAWTKKAQKWRQRKEEKERRREPLKIIGFVRSSFDDLSSLTSLRELEIQGGEKGKEEGQPDTNCTVNDYKTQIITFKPTKNFPFFFLLRRTSPPKNYICVCVS